MFKWFWTIFSLGAPEELWSAGYSWDEVLPDEIQTRWKKDVQVLNQLLK